MDFHLDIGADCGSNCSKTDFAAGGNYSSLVYTTRATTVITEHDPSTPLFLHTPFQSVHGPIQAPPESVYGNIWQLFVWTIAAHVFRVPYSLKL